MIWKGNNLRLFFLEIDSYLVIADIKVSRDTRTLPRDVDSDTAGIERAHTDGRGETLSSLLRLRDLACN